MNIEQITRFKDAPWLIEEDFPIIIGGAGGISSWLILFLSRININNNLKLFVYDFDKIDEVNLAGQFYKVNQINQYKVDAVKQLALEFCNSEIVPIKEKYDKNSMQSIIMFAGFDNMEARKVMFEKWCNECKEVEDAIFNKVLPPLKFKPLFIDGRLLSEQLQILCVTPENKDKYKEKYLFSDSEVADVACTFKQTSHVAAMIGSLMVSFFLNHITNCKKNDSARHVPFYYEYFTPLNLTDYDI